MTIGLNCSLLESNRSCQIARKTVGYVNKSRIRSGYVEIVWASMLHVAISSLLGTSPPMAPTPLRISVRVCSSPTSSSSSTKVYSRTLACRCVTVPARLEVETSPEVRRGRLTVPDGTDSVLISFSAFMFLSFFTVDLGGLGVGGSDGGGGCAGLQYLPRKLRWLAISVLQAAQDLGL